jgi:hypothetical protein
MASEREIIEAKLREFFPRDEYMAVNGLGSEEYEADTATGAEEIAAALRESRKADVEAVNVGLRRGGILPHECADKWCHCHETMKRHNDALAALSRLAGDE